MHTNILIVRALEADLQRKLRVTVAQRAIHTEARRRPRLLAIRSAARGMQLRPTPAVASGIPFERTPQ
jgi:hypothetical protein